MSMRKDYIAQWYEVREEQGVSDRIHCFLHHPARHLTDWQHYRHRDTDGIGMLTMVRTELGYTDQPLPLSRDRSEPGFWQTWRRRRQLPRETAAKTVHWRPPHNAAGNNAAGNNAETEALPLLQVLTPDELQALKEVARQRGVSVASLTLAALNKAVFDTCLQPGSQAWWFYPVNLRGAVERPPLGNVSSGFYLLLNAGSSAEEIHAKVKKKLQAGEHWLLWKMAHIGRWIGTAGVRFIYRRLSRSQFYLGSFSYLGDWSLPQHPQTILGCCGAGSANYPIATGVTESNGHLSLALKFHPAVASAQQLNQDCLQHWSAALRDLRHHV